MANRPVKNQNTINRWLNRYFSAVIAVFFLAFLLVAYFVIILPKAQATEEAIRANVLAKKGLYEKSRRKLANLEALGQTYQQLKPTDLEKFKSVLPSYYPPEKIFGELEELVGRGGWRINSISLASDSDGGPSAAATPAPSEEEGAVSAVVTGSRNERVGAITIDLLVEAIDYSGFKQLVRTLENNLRLFDIVSVQYSPSQSAANLQIKTYYYKNAE